MDAFEDLSITPDLTEALATEGIESPTRLQKEAIPVLRKGNSLVLTAGPGSGLLVAWAMGLLEHLDSEGDSTKALVLCATPEIANRLAESIARFASSSGHSVAALGEPWVLPGRAQILFGTAAEILRGLSEGTITAATIEAVVVDQAQLIENQTGLGDVERVLDYLPDGTQRVLSALPMTAPVTDLVERLFKRTMTLPAPTTSRGGERSEIRFRITAEPKEAAVLSIVAALLADGASHALVFFRNEDRAADVGDFLTLHGFTAGAPGDEAVPVWLAVDALRARSAVKGVDNVVVVSGDVPPDLDTLDRRHSISPGGVVVVLHREIAHLKSIGRSAGYGTVPYPPPPESSSSIQQLRDTVDRAMEVEDIPAYLVALEPLFERYDPAEVAAAAVALLRKKKDVATPGTSPDPARTAAAQANATPAWAKLFVGVGERDGLKTGDLLGAITGETGIGGEAVGKIDIKESHSLVEVHDSVARQVIQAINGTTIKGRSVRADFDRPRRGGRTRGPGSHR